MNRNDITYLLNKFYEGSSSIEEEKTLKEFFLNSSIPEEWKTEKEIFIKYLQAAEIPLPEGLEKRLNKKLSAHINQKRNSPTRFHIFRIISAAAVLLLCIGLFIGNLQSGDSRVADTFDDPLEAALVAEKTLIFLSQQLNTGINQVKEAQEEYNKINQIVYKQLKD